MGHEDKLRLGTFLILLKPCHFLQHSLSGSRKVFNLFAAMLSGWKHTSPSFGALEPRPTSFACHLFQWVNTWLREIPPQTGDIDQRLKTQSLV